MTAPDDPLIPTDVGGYRVVRVLALGSRACTVLAHTAHETRVARLLSASCPLALIDAELAVHDAVRQAGSALRDHAVELDDLVTLPDGRLALLFDHLGGPALADVLATQHGQLALGEAVTILAPIVEALDAAHDAGITGIGLAAADIRFSTAGAPVLTRLHDAVAGPILPARFRARDAAYPADLSALDRLCSAVASSVAPPERAALVTALHAPARERSRAHALFDLAKPVPVRLAGLPAPGEPVDESVALNTAAPDPVPTSPSAARTLSTLRLLGLPPTIVSTIELAVDRVARVCRGLVSRAATALSPTPSHRGGVRPRFALAGVAGATALIVAITLMGEFGGAADADDTAAEGDIGPRAQSIDAGPSVAESALHPAPEQWQAIVDTLVTRWVDCRRSLASSESARCTSEVAHAGSAAELLIATDDARHEVLERWSAVRGEAAVVERMGAAVLIDLVAAGTTTASLLVVRSEAGWRIRDVIG